MTESASPTPVKRVGILVCGMHRSGTSALSRVLHSLGCDLPKTLLGANPTNEAGHWESDVARAFNDEILDSAGSDWNDWLAISPGWYTSPKYEAYKERGAAILRDEFGPSRLFVFKDPRICRMTRFWLDVLDAENVATRVIFPVRNPLEVAASLKTRDGAEASYTLILWLRHVLDAESGTRGRVRFFCSYDALMQNWADLADRAQKALHISWPRMSISVDREVSAFLNRNLRHHQFESNGISANPLLSDWIKGAYEIFERWARTGEDEADYATLDEVRRAFDAAAPAFAMLVSAGKAASQEARLLRDQLGTSAGAIDHAETRLRDLEAVNQALRCEIEENNHRATEQVTVMHGEVAGHQQAAVQLREELGRVDADRAQLTTQYEQALTREAELGVEITTLRIDLEKLVQIVAQNDTDIAQSRAAAGQSEAEAGRLKEELQQIIAQRDADVAQASAAIAQGEAEVERLKEELRLTDADRMQIIAQRDADVAQARAAVAQSEAEAERLKEQLRQIESDRAQIVARYEQAAIRVAELEAQGAAFRADLERLARIEAEAELKDRDIESLTARLIHLKDEVGSLDGRYQSMRDRAETADSLARELSNKLSETQSALAQRTAETDETSKELRIARMAAEDLQRDLDAVRGATGKLEAELALERERGAASEASTRAREVRLADLESQVEQFRFDRARLEERISERFQEIATLTRMLRQQTINADARAAQIDWIKQVVDIMMHKDRWMSLLPARWHQAWILRKLARRELFDGASYLADYPDVAEVGMNPLRHYVLHGMHEGRPTPNGPIARQ